MLEDAVKAAPDQYKILHENERVRILEHRSMPGSQTRMHSHPDMVACAIRDSSYKFTLPNGECVTAELKAGHAVFVKGMDHITENVGKNETHVIVIELK